MNFVDTLFFHPDGHGAVEPGERIATGVSNPRLDNPFLLAIAETDGRKWLATQERLKVEHKIRLLQEQHSALLEKEAALAEHRTCQIAAISRYHETGEVDPILVPDCEQEYLAALAAAEAADAAPGKLEEEAALEDLPEVEGWEVSGSRVDDEFVYVTLKRPRLPRTQPDTERAQSIKKAMKAQAQNATQAWAACPDHVTFAPAQGGRSLRQLKQLRAPRGP
jgi:hypothetical protein